MKEKQLRRITKAVINEKPGLGFWKLIREVEATIGGVTLNADKFQRQVSRMVKQGKIKHKWSTEPPREPHFYPRDNSNVR